VKFFHAFALFFLGLTVGWAVLWAIKWVIAPSPVVGSMPDELFAIEVGSFLLALIAGSFAGVQFLCDCFGSRR